MKKSTTTQVPVLRKDHQRCGGHLALDFLNTVAKTEAGTVDQLGSEAGLLRWLSDSGLPGGQGGGGRGHIAEAVSLRETIRDLLQKRMARERADPSLLNSYLERAAGHWSLTLDEADGLRRSFVRKGGADDAVLAPVAEAAADLLTSAELAAVKRCGNPECTMFFLDPSATGRRRWCDMATCGTRMKVAAFRERQRSGTLTPR